MIQRAILRPKLFKLDFPLARHSRRPGVLFTARHHSRSDGSVSDEERRFVANVTLAAQIPRKAGPAKGRSGVNIAENHGGAPDSIAPRQYGRWGKATTSSRPQSAGRPCRAGAGRRRRRGQWRAAKA